MVWRQFVSLVELVEFGLDHLQNDVNFSLHEDPLLHALIPDLLLVEYCNAKRSIRPIYVRL